MLNVGGYKVSKDLSNCPIFVTYKKSEDISETTKYEDEFLSLDKFSWMSQSNRKIDSRELIPIINQKNSKIRIPLFIKKSDDEGDEHYFIGNLSLLRESVKQTFIKKEGKDIPIVNMHFLIDKKVDEKIYDYITS